MPSRLKRQRVTGVAVLLILGMGALSVAATPPADVQFTPDVVYGKTGGEELKLDLARPKNAEGPLACVLVIHGGGWSAGNKRDNDDVAWRLAQHGYVAASIEYRLAPAHPFPAQVEDVKCAVRFLRAHAAEYKIDPKKFGAIGFSAGAHLSLMLGLTTADDKFEGDGGNGDQPSRVQAVVSFFGPTDLAATDLPPVTGGILRNFIGGSATEKPEAYRQASPLSYVAKNSAGAPPILLLQGTMDPLVPVTQAYRLADALTKAGVAGCRVDVLIGAGHGWGGEEFKRTAEESLAFLDKNLKPSTVPPK